MYLFVIQKERERETARESSHQLASSSNASNHQGWENRSQELSPGVPAAGGAPSPGPSPLLQRVHISKEAAVRNAAGYQSKQGTLAWNTNVSTTRSNAHYYIFL